MFRQGPTMWRPLGVAPEDQRCLVLGLITLWGKLWLKPKGLT